MNSDLDNVIANARASGIEEAIEIITTHYKDINVVLELLRMLANQARSTQDATCTKQHELTDGDVVLPWKDYSVGPFLMTQNGHLLGEVLLNGQWYAYLPNTSIVNTASSGTYHAVSVNGVIDFEQVKITIEDVLIDKGIKIPWRKK